MKNARVVARANALKTVRFRPGRKGYLTYRDRCAVPSGLIHSEEGGGDVMRLGASGGDREVGMPNGWMSGAHVRRGYSCG